MSKVDFQPAVHELLALKRYVDGTMHESSMLRLDPNEKLPFEEQDSIIHDSSLKSPKKLTEIPTKSSIDNLYQESERYGKVLGLDLMLNQVI